MANFTSSRLGLVNNTGSSYDALFLKTFSGEVLIAFRKATVFESLHNVRTISSVNYAITLRSEAISYSAEFDSTTNIITLKNLTASQMTYLDEIKSILNSLGYVESEIKDSIELITTNKKENTLLINSLSAEEKTELMDKHLKKILLKLSQKTT